MLVTKKDGTHEPFNDKKIIDAVNKSAERCNNKKYDADKLLAMVHKTVDNCNELTVAIIHEAVITALNSLNKEIAEKYSSYHNYRQDFVKMLDTIHRASQKIRYIGDKENANSDSALVSTKRCLIFNELNKQLYRKFFMRADELQACKDGYIYIHDQNARLDTVNCCLFDMGKVLKGGFEMGNLKYTEPNSIATAFNVMADVILATASQQYGGFTICEVDKILSLYAKKSYQKYRDEYLSIKNNMADAIRWATDHVERDIEQGYQGIEMTLNSVGSSRGDYPFITFTFGLGSDPFSQLISITMLNVHKKGQGGKPVLFPKLVFLYDKNLHDEGCINHDVYLSALSCSAKTMYPDWLSLTGDGYVPSMYKKYGKVVSPMGCAEGSHTVGYSYRGEYYYESLKRLWDKMSELYGSQKQANGRDEYIIPKDLAIYDTKKGFVKVTCMNRNTQSKWVKVKIKGGRYLKVTDDHPLPTQRGRVLARDLRIGDKVTVNYSQYVNETKSMLKDEAWLLGFMLCDGCYNEYRQIPTCIFSCNRDSRLSFLAGLIDADGHLDAPDKTIRLQLGSTNEELALQQVALLQSVGVKAKVYPSRYGSGNKLRYKVEGFITQELYDRIVCAKKRVNGDFAKPIEGECLVEAEIYDLEPYEKEQYAYDVTTESDHFELNHVYSHNCRAFLSPWYERGGMEPEDESDTPVFVGRFNMGVVSLHLPMILAKARKENKDFYKVLDYYLEMIRGIHKRTYDYLGELKASVNPVCFCEGGFYGGHLKPSDKIKPLLKAMTASFGITALNELQRLYNGKSLVEDGEFALEVMKYINDYINRIKYEDNILYATYGTPAENLCFSGDTTVQTFSGYKKIKDITTDDLVYSFNEKEHKIELKPVIFAGKTGENRQVVKVTFDNGQEIICTPNHQFAVRKINVGENGKVQGKEYIEYVPAGLLKEGTRIKSNYITEKNGRPFCSIYHNGKIQGIHEINAEYKLGKKPNGYVIHHLDEDKYNNSFDNLVYWTEAKHKKYHMKDTIGKYCYTSEQVVGENNPFYNKHHTEVSKQLNRERHLGKNNVQSKAIVELDLNGNIINTFESKGMAEAHYDDVSNLSYALNAKYTTKSNPHEYKGRLWYFQDDIENISFVNHTVRSVEYLDEAIDVYDITVADNHNFFVGGAHGVLVHNCGKQIEQFRKIYGVVENVSDKAYVSNSFHCHVSEDINPIEKQDLEGRFWDFFNGGKIQYVRYPVQYNTEAIDTLIKRAMKKGFYEGVNLSLAYCDDCGYEQLEMDVCPKCGSKNITKIDRMNGYLAYSRIHGDTRLNDAKMAEIKDRKSM